MSEQQLIILQKDITETIIGKIDTLKEEGLTLPSNYNHTNALKSAFFKLNDMKVKEVPVLQACTTSSIANTLLDMVVQGLSPAKNQCYFIARGNQLTLMRSYFGTQLVLKRLSNISDIWANVIYDGDVFDYENYRGRERLLKHETKFQNRDNEVIGAYAIIEMTDGEQILTVMTRNEINMAWGQSDAKKWQKPNDTKQTVHDKFPQEMGKRTVINRAAKNFINTAIEENDNLIAAINNTTENEYDNERKDMGEIEEVQQKIKDNANKEPFDFVEKDGVKLAVHKMSVEEAKELTELVIKDVSPELIEELKESAGKGEYTFVERSEPTVTVIEPEPERVPIVIDLSSEAAKAAEKAKRHIKKMEMEF